VAASEQTILRALQASGQHSDSGDLDDGARLNATFQASIDWQSAYVRYDRPSSILHTFR